MRILPSAFLVTLSLAFAPACADQPARSEHAQAHYLANAGVMFAYGEQKILFDPLFQEGFGQYRLLPVEIERALFDGLPPWDGVDAIFISHYHDDHFSPDLMLRFLAAQAAVQLYAPAQAVAALKRSAGDDYLAVADRVHPVQLEYGEKPLRVDIPGIVIEAVRIPHSGWPGRMQDVENIAFRVTLEKEATVVHLGDADTKQPHFSRDADYWRARQTDLALPPYWYFLSPNGQAVLEKFIVPTRSVGVHVPDGIPMDSEKRQPGLQEADLFKQPGETREIDVTGDKH